MTTPDDAPKAPASTARALCGDGQMLEGKPLGCGAPVTPLYRCVDCDMQFCRKCIREHFNSAGGGTPAQLSERARVADRDCDNALKLVDERTAERDAAKVEVANLKAALNATIARASDVKIASHLEAERLRAALKIIGLIGCMQSAEESESWCKHDGSRHSCYCPAGIALAALGSGAPPAAPHPAQMPFLPCTHCGGAVTTWGTDAQPVALLVCKACGKSRPWSDERVAQTEATLLEGAAAELAEEPKTP